jgi:nitrite reductase (NADH) small subunit
MLVMSFAVEGVGNCAEVGGVPYVYARTTQGAFVSPARCAHRGGPLHLATIEPGNTRMVCPWHGRGTSMKRLLTKGIPAVRSGGTVTAVFPVSPTTATATTYRPISPDLCKLRAASRTVDTATPRHDPVFSQSDT